MIRSLQLGNFKAFGQTQTIPIKPITLIFGPNSAGKSSIIHSLALMHEAWNNGSLDATYTDLGGESIDLGGFKQYVHRGEMSRVVEWSVSLEIPEHQVIKALDVSWRFRMALDDKGKPLKGVEPTVSALEIGVNGQRLLRFSEQGEQGLGVNTLDTGHELVAKVIQETIDELKLEGKGVFKTPFSALVDELVVHIESKDNTFFPSSLVLDSDKLPVSQHATVGANARVFQFLFVQKFNEVFQELRERLSEFFQSAKYLGPLRSLPQRRFEDAGPKSTNWNASGEFAWEEVRKNDYVRQEINEWLGSATRLKTPYELKVKSYVPESDLKAMFFPDHVREILKEDWELDNEDRAFDLESWLSDLGELTEENLNDLPQGPKLFYESLDGFCEEVSEQAALAVHVLKTLSQGSPEDEFNRVLTNYKEAFGQYIEAIGWTPSKNKEAVEKYYCRGEFATFWDEFSYDAVRQMALKLIEEDFSDRRDELVLIDRRRNTRVSHRDVGIGISQVLPVLVHAFGATKSLVAIEQPEIHIHPALQAELADVFIESALGDRKNTFLIETHSEHLILRLLRRIRESEEGSKPIVKPEDIAVIYVDPDNEGTRVVEIPIDEDGEFTKRWPDGFFTERRKELF